jgi:regulator of RNase E activity RraA
MPATLGHEIVMAGRSPAYPVGQRRDDVCCGDEKGVVVLPERRREDDQEETDGEDLCVRLVGGW